MPGREVALDHLKVRRASVWFERNEKHFVSEISGTKLRLRCHLIHVVTGKLALL